MLVPKSKGFLLFTVSLSLLIIVRCLAFIIAKVSRFMFSITLALGYRLRQYYYYYTEIDITEPEEGGEYSETKL